MRYFLRDGTLFLRGDFRAASTGVNGGLRKVSTIFNHTIPEDFPHDDPAPAMDALTARQGFFGGYFGLLTAVPMRHLCILQYDFITVFVTAGIREGETEPPGTVNIIACSSEGLSEGALLEVILTVTTAKAAALQAMGYPVPGTPTDAVIAACEGEVIHRYAGTLTPAGKRLYAAAFQGVQEGLRRFQGEVARDGPSLLVYSRYGGDHWVEWTPEGCPYYPCHFEGQRCDYCYCPFYPCGDPELGQWMASSRGGQVWNCAGCTLIHEPAVADHLVRYPEATLRELKKVREKKKSA
jgi:adenosylcobinamide hydrolase